MDKNDFFEKNNGKIFGSAVGATIGRP